MNQLKELAERSAEAKVIVEALGWANQATEIADRIKQDARYKIAWDSYMKAEREYRNALEALSAVDLAEITHG